MILDRLIGSFRYKEIKMLGKMFQHVFVKKVELAVK